MVMALGALHLLAKKDLADDVRGVDLLVRAMGLACGRHTLMGQQEVDGRIEIVTVLIVRSDSRNQFEHQRVVGFVLGHGRSQVLL